MKNQVRSEKLEFVWQYFGLAHQTYHSFYDYFDKIGILGEESENARQYYKMIKKGIYEVMFTEKYVFICKVPLRLLRDDRNRLHSTKEAAIQFRDGVSYHYIHGVYFNQDLWQQVIERKLSPKQLLELKETDQRFVALNHYGFEKALKELNPKLVDKSKKGNQLYKIKFGEVELKFLLYPDTVTGDNRVSFVKPEFEDADQAMAWKHNMTKEQYLRLEIEA